MITDKIFDYKICRFHCADEKLFISEDLISSVDEVFNSPDLDQKLENQNGMGLSTFGISKYQLLKLNGIKSLSNWITQQILTAAPYFGYYDVKDVEYYRTFMNKMWPGSSGNIHAHDKNGHGVAVFYFKQPENGSDLVVVKDSYLGANVYEMPTENLHFMNVKQGDLILHETLVWHGISLHKGESPRIVFVLEYKYL